MPPSMLFRSRTRGHDGPWKEPSPAFEGLDTTHGEGNVAFVEFSVLSRDTVFLSDEHSPPRAFPDSQPLSQLRCCSSIGDSPLPAQTSNRCRTVQCVFGPSSLSIRPNRTPGTSGFGLERAQKQREAAAWPPPAPAPTLGQPWFVFAIIITIFLSRLQGREALSLRMSCRLRWFASQAIKTLLTDTVTV